MKISDFLIKAPSIVNRSIADITFDESAYIDMELIPIVDDNQKYIGSISKKKMATATQSDELVYPKLVNDTSFILRSGDLESLIDNACEAVVVNDQGQYEGIVFFTSIIKQLSKRAVEQWKRYESVFDSTPNGILAVDKDGYIFIANKTVCELIGLSKEDIIERHILEIIPSSLLPSVLETQTQLIGKKISIGNNADVVANLSPIICDGKTAGAVSVFQDISIVEKVASELREVKSIMLELESIIDSSYDGLTVVDGNGIMLRVNSAYERLTGINGKDIIGKHMQDLINEGYYNQSVSLMAIEKRARVTINQKIKGDRTILVTGTPVFDEEGNLVRVVNNNRDVTELINLQKEFNESKELNIRYKTELSHLRSIYIKTDKIIYRSKSMEQAIVTAQKVASVESSVLITGESGTGKELIAKLIHSAGRGDDKPYIKINCAALPEQLLESELFGYEKGSFTGAKKEGKPGLFELAHNGTLFLDEIGDMPLVLQVKILRALQEKEIMRVGGEKPVSVNVRIIAATHRDLGQMAEKGIFREDLYYRLMVVPIHLPPLRERKEDIPILIWHFIEKYNQKYNFKKSISNEAVDQMVEYRWKGNVRELENVVERIMVTSNDDIINLEHLPEPISRRTKFIPNKNAKLKTALEETEVYLLSESYKTCRSWDQVAEKLGIPRATAYRKASKHGLIKNQ